MVTGKAVGLLCVLILQLKNLDVAVGAHIQDYADSDANRCVGSECAMWEHWHNEWEMETSPEGTFNVYYNKAFIYAYYDNENRLIGCFETGRDKGECGLITKQLDCNSQ